MPVIYALVAADMAAYTVAFVVWRDLNHKVQSQLLSSNKTMYGTHHNITYCWITKV